jgi:hypothetical protein
MARKPVVGALYTRKDIAEIFDNENIATSREGPVYMPDRGMVLLFVTLEKDDWSAGLQYRDWFNGEIFHWDSQNRQNINSPRIRQMVEGSLKPQLFVRVRAKVKGVTQPFVFAGQLEYVDHEAGTSNPVHIMWRCLEFVDDPNRDLATVYAWLPQATVRADSEAAVTTVPITRGQGYNSDPVVRQKTEMHAMDVAKAWYQAEGFAIRPTHSAKPWDFECLVEGLVRVRVEVKGTIGGPEAVILTHNEVRAVRMDNIPTHLFIVHGIEVRRSGSDVSAGGGSAARIVDWKPSDIDLKPTQYRYAVPQDLLSQLSY